MVGNPVFNNLPLCEYGNGTNNPNGCPSAYGIFGSVIYDANNNCIEDGDEIGLENVTVKLYNNLGVLEGITSTSVQGSYFFPGNPNSYTVEIDTAMTGFGVSCSYPGIDSVFSFTSPDSVIRDIDFLADVNCSLGFDIGTQSINIGGMAFPGLLHKLDIISGDVSNWYGLTCSSGIGGTIVVDVTGPVSFNSVPSTALYPTIAGTTYTYTISDFGNLNIYEDFSLYFETDTLAQIGDSVCVNVAVSTSITGDFNLVNNNYTYCYYVGNSYDPNDKTVYPIQVSPGYNDWLIYTIQFQNTGTAPAFNIRLEDTLSDLLDFSTFEVIGYKHANTYNLTNDKLTIFFPNIQLPDSTTNEPESKGYFQYRIKPISGLAEGTEINNTAHIFFDYNDAIITNTAVTSFIQTDLTIQEHNDLKFNVFPNPSKGVFFVNSDSYTQVRSIEVFNAIGQQVPVKMKKNGHITEIRFPENSKGLFVLKIRTDNEVFSKKVIIN